MVGVYSHQITLDVQKHFKYQQHFGTSATCRCRYHSCFSRRWSLHV